MDRILSRKGLKPPTGAAMAGGAVMAPLRQRMRMRVNSGLGNKSVLS
jgi:hypothetical protein